MSAIKITAFQGTAPRASPELLPATSAQVARNCKLYSGDLIPYPQATPFASTGRSGTTRTLYALRNPTTNALVWLSWTSDVSIVTPATDELAEQRFYYAGDGAPKVSNYNLATAGSPPYPIASGYYDLGLPLPIVKLAASATPFTSITGVTRSRDRGNNVTITTTPDHNIKDGATVSLSNFGDASFDAIATVVVTGPKTFTYYSVGPAVASGVDAAAVVDLGSQIQSRNYVYTWYTPWGEESIGSDPSDPLFIKEGQIVTVSGIPSAAPAGRNFVRGVRLYRTLAGTTETEYFRLATLWFPNVLTRAQRTSNVSRVTFAYPHNLLEGDRFKLSGAGGFNITDGIVASIIDQYTFNYAQAGANVSSSAVTGILYYDAAENSDKPARYWGDGGVYTFTDDFDYQILSNTLQTDEYDPPPDDLSGIVILQNNIMAGFSGNDVYFSEPNQFHAWPRAYKRSFESAIVGLAAVGGTLLVLTTDYPYIVEGSDPAVMTQLKLPSRYPCLNRRSIVSTNFGVIYATHDGLAIFAASAGAQLITRALHSSDTWNAALNPATLVGVSYKDTYFASHSSASLVFDPGDKGNPSFVDIDFVFSAAWYDTTTNALYTTVGTAGDVYRWDDTARPSSTQRWKSKVYKIDAPTNIGAARVIADYPLEASTSLWEDAAVNWENAFSLWYAAEPITFRLYVDKELYYTKQVSSDRVFRLPAGYKSDTFEVELESQVRVRAIHLGQTPTSLKGV